MPLISLLNIGDRLLRLQLRRQLEQHVQRSGFVQRQQRSLELEHEHRVPLRFTAFCQKLRTYGFSSSTSGGKGACSLALYGLKKYAAYSDVPVTARRLT